MAKKADRKQRTPKKRADLLLFERGLVESREKARRLILAGKVHYGTTLIQKASDLISVEQALEIKESDKYVSRGGKKLEAALKAFNISVRELICMDVGASTGGFTDCLLQHGAQKVFAVDVGRGQLHWKMRSDSRVNCMEGINARYLDKNQFPEMDLVTCDVSFISLSLVLPAITSTLKSQGKIIALIKPQFEAGREYVEKGGVVKDPKVHTSVTNKVKYILTDKLGFDVQGTIFSPIVGPAGNKEILIYAVR